MQSTNCILGALTGDALGVPFEFRRPADIPALIDMDMRCVSQDFRSTYPSVAVGTWSDDGSQVMCLLEALLKTQGNPDAFSNPEFAHLMLAWLDSGYHQSGGRVFDVGHQTRLALNSFRHEGLEYIPFDKYSNGNGSLMRSMAVVAAAIHFDWPAITAGRIAMLQSRVTHPHPISMMTCALYAVIGTLLAKASEKSQMDVLIHQAADIVDQLAISSEQKQAVDKILLWPTQNKCQGSGFVIDAFWTAMACLQASQSYTTAVTQAIQYGNDTDTTACITGGLAGIIWGNDPILGIPKSWLGQLKIPPESRAILDEIKNAAPKPVGLNGPGAARRA